MTNADKRQMLIAKIHIAKKDLGLDDDTYRDVLVRVTGKDSCKLMTNAELVAVCREYKRLGFIPKQAQTKSQAKPKYGKKPSTIHNRQDLINKIEAMLSDMGLHWNYAHSMAKHMFGVDFVHWLEAKRLYKVAQALAVYQKRQKK